MRYDEMNEARDPVTGTPASHARHRADGKMTADDIADRIRGTRAQMSATLDEIEERLSPARISHEIRSSVRDTVDEVRSEIHPRRMAKRAGDTMLETVKENPIPALAAGLSIGYLIMKAGQGGGGSERRPAYGPYAGPEPWRGRGDRPWEYEDPYPSARPYTSALAQDHAPRSGDEESMRDRMSERGQELRHEASERIDDVQNRARERAHLARERAAGAARQAQYRAQEMGRSASRHAVRAERTIEEFVQENPLVAGLITAGIGALVGSAFPATRKEDELMGHTRDQIVNQARDTASEKAEQAKGAARRVGEEARRHAEDLKATVQEEARSMRDGEERRGADEQSGTTGGEFAPDNPGSLREEDSTSEGIDAERQGSSSTRFNEGGGTGL